MELQQLEIQISEKKIKEAQFKIEQKKKDIKTLESTLEERTKDLANKKTELEVIIAESQEEEVKLNKERIASSAKVEERLFKSYERLRNNAINGLAVVLVKRGACGGCFNTVPPQRQADVKEKKKLIICEHCGRILGGVDNGVLETA